MNLFKKVTASVALAAIASGLFAVSASAYTEGELKAANYLAEKNIINDRSSEPAKYNLEKTILRQEMAKVATKLYGIDPNATCENKFADVSATTPNTWICGYVEALLDNGKLSKNKNYTPESNVTKSEAVKMVLQSLDFKNIFTDSTKWQEQSVAFAASKGMTETFTDYNTKATRGFVFELAYNAMMVKDGNTSTEECDPLIKSISPELCDVMKDDSDDKEKPTPVVDGDVVAELNPDTPKAQNIPQNSENNEFLKFDVTAGESDVTINSMTFKRTNLGSRDNIDRVWLTQDGIVVTRDKAVSVDDTVTLTFSDKVIKSGETETFTLNASMDTGANNVHAFELISMDTDADNEEIKDVKGNPMTTVDYGVSTIRLEEKGFDSDIDVGTENTMIGEFKLSEVNSASKKDVIIKSIRFKTSGGADLEEDFKGMAIYEGNKKVSTATIIDGKYVTFKLDNFELKNGESKFFSINADIVAGEDKDTVTFQLKDGFDIYALEKGTNVGAGFDKTGSDSSLAEYTLNSGRMILTKDASSPTAQDALKSTKDVTVLVAKVDIGQKVSLDKLMLNFRTNIASIAQLKAEIDTVSIYKNDELIGSEDKAVSLSAGAGQYEFDSYAELEDNDVLTVKINLTENAVANSWISFSLDNTGSSDGNSASFKDVEYLSNGDNLKQNRFVGSADGQRLTVKPVINATIARNDGYVNGEDLIAGQTNAIFKKFVLSAPNTSELNVRKLVFDATFTGGGNDTQYGNFKLVTGGKDVGEVAIIDGNTLSINRIDTIIPATKQQAFMLVGDVRSNAVGTIQLATQGSVAPGESVFFDVNNNEVDNIVAEMGSIAMNVRANAKLDVAAHGDMPKEQLVSADSTGTEIAKYKFRAKYGTVGVKELDIDLTGSDAAITSLVNKLTIFADGKEVKSIIGPKNNANNNVVLGSDNKITIPSDKDTIITIKADFNSVSDIDTNSKLIVKDVKIVKAITDVTGNQLAAADVVVNVLNAAKTQYVVNTVPTVAQESLSDKELTTGEKTGYKFKLTADNTADVTLGKVTFDVAKNGGATANNYELFIDGIKVTASELETGAPTVTGNNVAFEFTTDGINDLVVSKGSSKVVELKYNVTAAPSGSSITTKLAEDTTYAAAAAYSNTANFVWSDNAANPHSRTTTDWLNGYKVKGFESLGSSTLSE